MPSPCRAELHREGDALEGRRLGGCRHRQEKRERRPQTDEQWGDRTERHRVETSVDGTRRRPPPRRQVEEVVVVVYGGECVCLSFRMFKLTPGEVVDGGGTR